jgi:hypothetical protein
LQAVIDDTLYELYAPLAPEVPKLDIVFFHGLQLTDYRNAWWRTWLLGGRDDSGGNQGPVTAPACWPRKLLGSDFPDARVLSVCYDASARCTTNQGRLDLEALGDQLAGALLNTDAGVGQRPLVLVGHSLGGLMLQQVCLCVDRLANACPDEALKRRASSFIDNVVGAVFYSSPLAGSRLADLANNVKWLAGLGPVMPALTTLSLKAHRVTGPFDDLRKREREKRRGSWATLGFCETNATSLGRVGVGDVVFDGARAGARRLGGGRLDSAFAQLMGTKPSAAACPHLSRACPHASWWRRPPPSRTWTRSSWCPTRTTTTSAARAAPGTCATCR